MPYLFQKRGIRVIYKGSIFVQKSIAVNPQRICKCHRYIVLNGVSVILIQNQCRGHNANLFCQFPCGETLECPVILQILARCGAFFIGFVVKGQMNHDFAFRIEVNPCVIEITIGKPIYDAILADLNHAISDTVWMSPDAFMPHLTEVLSKATTDKKLLEKIADGLSVMDKNAEIQRDRKGNIIYDKETKDTELVRWEESIEDYMAREVLPHIPDAAAFFEEDLSAKKPVIKTGAEIPFTRYFYKYQQPTASEELEAKFSELELSVSERVAKLFE